MKQGYTKRVLEAQIRKYEVVLTKDDKKLISWLKCDFGGCANCPVCYHRCGYGNCYHFRGQDNLCLALVDRILCVRQEWYQELSAMKHTKVINTARVRQILKTRLKYWQRIYKEKYPEGS